MSNVILIGFMGSGKSTIGKEISRLADYKFIDTDQYIEQKEGRSIKKIFDTDGESFFRQLEQNAVLDLKRDCNNGYVIASGGGLPMNNTNRINLHEIGKIIYLRAKQQTLEKRLSGDTNRPLLAGDKIKEKIAALLSERSETYETLADIIIDTDNKSVRQIADEIILKGI